MSNYEKIVPIKIAQYRGLKQKDISWFVEFIKSGCFYSVAEDYINDQDKYVRNHSLYINGKYRNIITYRNDKNGVMLKNLHKEISKYLVLNHRPSSHSFAYRKKKNILMCIKKHENNSYFFKTDIHAFFDSVSYDNTLRIIKKKKSLIQSKRKNIDNEELFICFCTLLAACFYNNKLPIGFVTSPVLSDIYLSSFDRNISRFTKCIYTRYADDIIVSTNSENYMNDFVEIKMEIEKQFKELGLQLNSKKHIQGLFDNQEMLYIY